MRFDGFDAVGETITVSAQAEEAGADTIWMAEHLGYREAAVSCMAFALSTQRAMVIPNRRHALYLASDAHSNAVCDNGRSSPWSCWYLCVGG